MTSKNLPSEVTWYILLCYMCKAIANTSTGKLTTSSHA
jgi:hypothetical protein